MTPPPPTNQNPSSHLLEIQEKLEDLQRDESKTIHPATLHQYATIRNALYDRRKELVMNVQYFWLKALVNHPAFSLLITDVDSRILRKLLDIDVIPTRPISHPQDFDIVFTFAPNDYFHDVSLVKRYAHTDQDGRSVGVHHVQWKDDAAKEIVARKGRGGTSLSGFFRWIAEDTRDTTDLGELIRREVYPRAIELYFGTYTMLNTHYAHVDIPHHAY